MMNHHKILTLKFSATDVRQRTQAIADTILNKSHFIKHPNFQQISPDDLKRMYRLYDTRFFNGFFRNKCANRLNLRLSKRMTSAGGKTTFWKRPRKYEIAISTPLLFQTFADVEKDITVTGLTCHNRLEAMQRVFEHELIHLLEYVVFEKSSCNQPQFKKLANNIFRHKETYHDLLTQTEVAAIKYDIQPGSKVTFEADGKVYVGVVSRITKRATVMIPDPEGPFRDFQGARYLKAYVPLSMLRPQLPNGSTEAEIQ